MTNPRHTIRDIYPPIGPEITAKSWLTEAPMRMLMNNLHPDVAENPHELVVYGGIGRAARTWNDFDSILATLKTLNEELAEIVLADDGAPFLGLLAWPKPGTSLDAIAAKLAEFNEGQRGGSAKIRRVTLLETPPTADANEISDKGTINRRAVLDNRKSQVDALFADEPPASVRAI